MKTFTVTIIDNRTIAVDIEANSSQEAMEIVEESNLSELMGLHPHRIIDADFSIDEVTEN